jgi:fructokinase
MTLYGGIEAGGTKFICAIGTSPKDIRARAQFPTTTPQETLGQSVVWLQEQAKAYGSLSSIGIASFGPVDLNPASPTYGFITTTPKRYWAMADIVGAFQSAFDVPIGFDTDVNGAALAEYRWGAAQGLDVVLYLTIGTGIGGGVVINGKTLQGLLHPEMGHFRLPRNPAQDPFEGCCPFHGDCFEGLASGTAINARWQATPSQLPVDHPAWDLEAHYLALGVSALICTLSPQRILMGGGVMKHERLFPALRKKVQSYLNGYLHIPAVLDEIDTYIQPPALGDNTGVLGAFALAEQALPQTM